MRNLKKRMIILLAGILMVNFFLLGIAPMKVSAAPNTAWTAIETECARQIFDAQYYYDTYPDVAAAFGMDENKLFEHYLNFGIAENRNASESFNVLVYKSNYPDLNQAFGDSLGLYFKHYVEFGLNEGRNAIVPLNPVEVLVVPGGESGNSEIISMYTTNYNHKIARATNVCLAASQINGKVILPGETFSFLSSITPRTRENGYVVATVFSGGKVSKGIGGGICQVSSTLYAAVLGTDCVVNERHAHSLPVSYIPKGMDATVSSPNLDFRFTNTYDYPIMLTVSADTGVLTVAISAVK